MSEIDPALVGRTRHPACAPAGNVRFAHPSERLFATLLDLSGEAWQYEPVEFPLEWDRHGSPVAGFRPDFYLPRLGVFIELTTADQRLVTRKNRKVRRMRRALSRGADPHRVPARLHSASCLARPPSRDGRSRVVWPGEHRQQREGCAPGLTPARGARCPRGQDGPLRWMGDAPRLSVGHGGRAPRVPLVGGCLRRQSPGHGAGPGRRRLRAPATFLQQ